METTGYAVVRGVLSGAECQEAMALVWTWLEDLGTVNPKP
jgi:hypothetical protein